MKVVWVLCLLLIPSMTSAGSTRHYKIHDEDSGENIATMTHHFENREDGSVRVTVDYNSLTDTLTAHQIYELDAAYGTLRWEVQSPFENNEYTGERQGDRVRIRGTLQGEPVDLDIEVKGEPLFVYPSLSFEAFVRGDVEETEFWTFRPSDLSRHKMGVSKKGVETIEVAGQEIEAIKVKWGLTGFKSMFFQQEVWYRASDGVLMRTEAARGRWTEFVSEDSGP